MRSSDSPLLLSPFIHLLLNYVVRYIRRPLLPPDPFTGL